MKRKIEQEESSSEEEFYSALDHFPEVENDVFNLKFAERDFKDSTSDLKEESVQTNFGKISIRKPDTEQSSCSIKERLQQWQETEFQKELWSEISTYRDLLYCGQTLENSSEIRQTYCLHALNHIYKTRDRILKNNSKQIQARDQGFTRPRVLILAPFRNIALQIVSSLLTISGTKQHDNKKRFMDEYSAQVQDNEFDKRPDDFKQFFAGNNDDAFRIGLQFTRKNCKIYSEFYSSDVIVASPLGLKMLEETEFLSSIELVICDFTNVFLMQNWDHVQFVFDNLNLVPTQPHNCDFMRIKSWYLDGKARFFRQTLLFSEFQTPEINSIFNKTLVNCSGKTKWQPILTIQPILSQVPQVFQRIETSAQTISDDVFKVFTSDVMLKIQKSIQKHTLIFVPHYFDFVRLRNWMKANNFNFKSLSEYSSPQNVSRARLLFFNGEVDYLLMTERFYFFKRYQLKKVFNIVFYGLPDNSKYYAELVNRIDSESALQSGEPSTVTALFSKYDRLKMERILGASKTTQLLKSVDQISLI